MKKLNQLMLNLICLSKKTSLIIIFLIAVLFVSCEKELKKEEIVPLNSIYFSCTINNELIEFESPSAELFELESQAVGFGLPNKHSKDTLIIEQGCGFSDDNYRIEIRFSNHFVIDSVSSVFDVPNMKEYLFEEGSYQFQYLPLRSYELSKPEHLYYGVNISIMDGKNSKFYESNIDYRSYGNISTYNDFMENSLFLITKSYRLDQKNYPGIANFEKAAPWYLEANFKCKLYESHDTGNAINISDGVLKLCF